MSENIPDHAAPALGERTRRPLRLALLHAAQATRWHLFIAMLGLLLLIPLIPVRALWEPEELRYAEIVREMISTGEWFLLHINGVAYPDKPPLFYWSIAFLATLSGHLNTWTMRLPAVLGGVGSAVLTFEVGRRLLGKRTGILAGLLLLAMPFFMWSSSEARMDSLFTFWILASNLAAVLFIQSECKCRRAGLLIFVFAALALMTKGPAGLIVSLVAPVAYMLAIRQRGWILRIPWGRGFGLAALIILPWLITACIKGGWDFTYNLLFSQNVGRFAEPWIHRKPLLTFFWQFPAEFMPWIIFIPFMFYHIFSAQEQHRRRGHLYALCAFLSIFILFTLSRSKRSIYMLPCFPWAAIILAGLLDTAIARVEPEVGTRRVTVPLYVTIAGTVIAGTIFLGAQPWLSPILGNRLMPMALAMIVTGLVTLVLMLGGNRRMAVGVYLIGSYACWLTGTLVALPLVDRFKSAEEFTDQIAEHVDPQVPLAIRRSSRAGYGFYLDRIVPSLPSDDAVAAFFKEHPIAFCIVKESDMNRYRRQPQFPFWPVFRGRVGGRSHVLIANIPLNTSEVRLPSERVKTVQAGLYELEGLSGAVLESYTSGSVVLWAHQPQVRFSLTRAPATVPVQQAPTPDRVHVTVRNFPGGEDQAVARSPMQPGEWSPITRGTPDRVDLQVTPDGKPHELMLRSDRDVYRIVVFGGGRINDIWSVRARPRLRRKIRELQPTFVVHLGDLVNLGLEGEYAQAFAWLRSLGIPCYGVAGPEDLGAHNWGQTRFNELFGRAPQQFPCGEWTLTLVNSRIGLYGKKQLDWLEQSLPDNGDRGIVFMHHPPFNPRRPDAELTEGSQGDRMMEILRNARPQLAIAGHGAFFLEETVDGVPWVITRGGAEKIRSYGVKPPFREHHLILLNLTEKKVEYEAVRY